MVHCAACEGVSVGEHRRHGRAWECKRVWRDERRREQTRTSSSSKHTSCGAILKKSRAYTGRSGRSTSRSNYALYQHRAPQLRTMKSAPSRRAPQPRAHNQTQARVPPRALRASPSRSRSPSRALKRLDINPAAAAPPQLSPLRFSMTPLDVFPPPDGYRDEWDEPCAWANEPPPSPAKPYLAVPEPAPAPKA